PGSGQGDDPPPIRRDCHDRLGVWAGPTGRLRRVWRHQGRRRSPDQVARARAWTTRDQGQLRQPGPHRDRDVRNGPQTPCSSDWNLTRRGDEPRARPDSARSIRYAGRRGESRRVPRFRRRRLRHRAAHQRRRRSPASLVAGTMRIGLISDIHGNLVALDAVLAAFDRAEVDRIICLGDLAVLGPEPAGVIDRIRERGIATVRGNVDDWLTSGETPEAAPPDSTQSIELTTWTLAQLTASQTEFLRRLPLTLDVPIDD